MTSNVNACLKPGVKQTAFNVLPLSFKACLQFLILSLIQDLLYLVAFNLRAFKSLKRTLSMLNKELITAASVEMEVSNKDPS